MPIWQRLGVALPLLLALLGGGRLLSARAATTSAAEVGRGAGALPPTGPTLRLDLACGRGSDAGSLVRDFMYFVPLISPEPVDCTLSAGNTQRAILKGIERVRNGGTFTLRCQFGLLGTGALQNDYDHSAMVSRNAERLRGGERLNDILGYIRIEGEGDCMLEAKGDYVGGVPVVQRVTMTFTGGRSPSPVRIGLGSISGTPDAWGVRADAVAYVASLGFVRTAAPARMEVSLASLRDAQAGNSFADRFKGALKGAVANLFVPPVGIEMSGNLAMLDFAAALFTGAPTFTFPLAANLRSVTVTPVSATSGPRTTAEASVLPAASGGASPPPGAPGD